METTIDVVSGVAGVPWFVAGAVGVIVLVFVLWGASHAALWVLLRRERRMVDRAYLDLDGCDQSFRLWREEQARKQP